MRFIRTDRGMSLAINTVTAVPAVLPPNTTPPLGVLKFVGTGSTKLPPTQAGVACVGKLLISTLVPFTLIVFGGIAPKAFAEIRNSPQEPTILPIGLLFFNPTEMTEFAVPLKTVTNAPLSVPLYTVFPL